MNAMETHREHICSHPRHIFGVVVDPPLRPELMCILAEDPLVAVDHPAVYPDDSAFGNILSV